MKKSIKIVYLIEVLILFFVIIIGLYRKNFDINVAQLSFFGLLSLISLLIFRFPRFSLPLKFVYLIIIIAWAGKSNQNMGFKNSLTIMI